MRKISSRNRTVPQQSKLTSQVVYLKPPTNSFRSNPAIRNISTTTSNMEIEPNGADQVALSQADAAIAANDRDTSEEDELFETEEELQAELDLLEAEQAAINTKALKEKLANNGFAYRNILRSEKVKQHFTSPLSKENAMSPEDILLEIPKEDLHEVGVVQRRIFMPASFVQKWIIPTIRARNALKVQGTQLHT